MENNKLRRSSVWENFIVDSKDECYSICTLCGNSVFRGKSKSTTAMRRHLQLKHGKNMNIPIKNDNENLNCKTIKYKSNQISNKLITLFSIECLPFNLIQTKSFLSFCNVSGISNITPIPNDDSVRASLLSISNQLIYKISQDLFVNCSYCSLSIEIFPLISNSNVLQISCYWITDNLKYKNVVLGAKVFNPKTANVNSISVLIESILRQYDPLTSKVIAIVLDCNSLLSDAVYILINKNFFPSNVSLMVCFSDTINRLFKSILFMETYKNLDILHFIKILNRVIDIFQKDYKLYNKWNKELKNKTISLKKNQEWVLLMNSLINLDTQWLSFKEFIKPYISKYLFEEFFSNNFRKSLKEIIAVMTPLLEVVHMSFSEKYNTIGSMYPILRTCAVLYLKKPTPFDNWSLPLTPIGMELHSLIQKKIAIPWSSTTNTVISLSSILDPRYKDMKIFNDIEKANIIELFIKGTEMSKSNKYCDIYEINETNNSFKSNIPYFSVYRVFQEYKKITPCQYNDIPIPNIDSTQKKRLTSEAIVNDYLKHDLNPDDIIDVLKWWSTHKYKYDSITITVKKYYSIPFTSSPRDQIFSSTVNEFYNKRFRLEDDVAESCIMIRCNANHYINTKI